MPVSAADRQILRVAAAAFIALIVLGFFLAPSNVDSESATSYSPASRGAKAAYLLLQDLGYHVERWEQPLTALQADSHTVLIIADPYSAPDSKEQAALTAFIAAGGRVITNGITGARFLPEDNSDLNAAPASPSAEFTAMSPSPITRAAPKITLRSVAHWSGSSAIPLYGTQSEKVVVRYLRGQGDAIWMASATPLTNAGIRESSNLEFLLATFGDKQQTRILFDEYVHGYGEHAETEKSHPLMTALFVQSVILGFAVLLTFSRRSGPLRPVPPPSRLAPLEFVETLGGLYQQAHAASVAVDVYHQRFVYWITRRLGLNPNAASLEIDRAVRDRWGLKDEKFLTTLNSAAAARYQPDLPQKQALEIVKSLHAYAVQFKLFPKENI
jgi:Domain of unknown function (DUF4350)